MKSVSRLSSSICAVSLLLFVPGAHADDWGCEVLLCLSNPAGPTAVSQCIPPIRKLWRSLARGHAFPTCLMNNSQEQNARHDWASPRNCPPGYLSQDEDGTYYCRMRGVVTVFANGIEQSRIWWSNEDAAREEGIQSTPSIAPEASANGQIPH